MISKTYLTAIPYEIKTDRILSAWVGAGSQVPLWTTVEGLRETIGMARPVKVWRHSIYVKSEPPREELILCFAVKHIHDPASRLGDYAGNGFGIALEIDSRGVVSLSVEKKI